MNIFMKYMNLLTHTWILLNKIKEEKNYMQGCTYKKYCKKIFIFLFLKISLMYIEYKKKTIDESHQFLKTIKHTQYN